MNENSGNFKRHEISSKNYAEISWDFAVKPWLPRKRCSTITQSKRMERSSETTIIFKAKHLTYFPKFSPSFCRNLHFCSNLLKKCRKVFSMQIANHNSTAGNWLRKWDEGEHKRKPLGKTGRKMCEKIWNPSWDAKQGRNISVTYPPL